MEEITCHFSPISIWVESTPIHPGVVSSFAAKMVEHILLALASMYESALFGLTCSREEQLVIQGNYAQLYQAREHPR